MKKSAIALSALMITGSAGAPALAASFTADAVETRPGQQLRYGKLTVKDNLSRFEFQVMGKPVVQITDKTAKMTRYLSPLSRTYFEVKGTPNSEMDGDFAYASPCPEDEKIKCVKDKDEQLGGFKVEKWKLTAEGVSRPAYVWWEPARKMALRREFLNGSVQQMIMHGIMPYDRGRNAENWEILYMSPFGRYERGSVQYDANLGVAVLQNFPNGLSRSLNNVQEATPDDAAFAIPERYKKVEAPKPAMPPFTQPDLTGFADPKMKERMAPRPFPTPPAFNKVPDWVKNAHKKAMQQMKEGPGSNQLQKPEWVKKAEKEAMERMKKGPEFKPADMPEWAKKARKDAEERMRKAEEKHGVKTPAWVKKMEEAARNGTMPQGYAGPWGGRPWGYGAPGWGAPRAYYGHPAYRGYYAPRPAPWFNHPQAPGPKAAR